MTFKHMKRWTTSVIMEIITANYNYAEIPFLNDYMW